MSVPVTAKLFSFMCGWPPYGRPPSLSSMVLTAWSPVKRRQGKKKAGTSSVPAPFSSLLRLEAAHVPCSAHTAEDSQVYVGVDCGLVTLGDLDLLTEPSDVGHREEQSVFARNIPLDF